IHELGMEIILDVVYNHTGEGGEGGDIFNFKVLGNEIYYKIEDGKYMNCSGTGNTLDTSNDLVKHLILESLRYWVVYMGVDGFRFDLASILGQNRAGEWMEESILKEMSYDPILSNVKLIAESWDAKGCYDVGKMPYLFREWSDCFRDTMRRFIKGDIGIIEQVALCIAGKEIQFEDTRKTELNAIHFITAHDGFTLWDLVAYNLKHNELNGEDNRDGNDANYSDNCGIEGETDDEEVLKLRKRRVKNYFMLLLLSKGVPMILMGDEMGRTQRGNNNAYCQENEILWVDWHKQDKFEEIRDFVRSLIKIRKEITLARRDKTEESWHGVKYKHPDWSYYSRSLAYCITAKDKVYYVAMNNYIEALNFELPPRKEGWTKRIDTYNEIQEEKVIGPTYQVKPYSICLFESNNGIRH
ncbi:MAG: glycogen debranching enzyme, partial [Cellulosilyticaceae bacterium]